MNSNNSNTQKFSRSRVKKRSFLPLVVLLVAAVAVAISLYFSQQKSPQSFSEAQKSVVKTIEKTVAGVTKNLPRRQESSEIEVPLLAEESHKQLQQAAQEQQSFQEEEILKIIDPETEALSFLNTFYQDLDSREYMKQFSREESSKIHFSRLIQKLLDNPPVVVRETDDLYTLLTNTAHFFRILGQNNVLMLKGILDREKESLEDILHSFYILSQNPEILQKELFIDLNEKSLYDYAGFFLNTMGGRLYLFRRDSTSRMAVTYYAIRIIDHANDTHNSPHGIDIRPAITALIDEMETGGNGLHYRDEYLEKLYFFQKKYQQ